MLRLNVFAQLLIVWQVFLYDVIPILWSKNVDNGVTFAAEVLGNLFCCVSSCLYDKRNMLCCLVQFQDYVFIG